MGDQPCRKAATYVEQHKQQKKRGLTSMSRVSFAPTIPVFERVKIFRDSDRAVTVIGTSGIVSAKFITHN
jgi:hypothetical protein